MHKFILYPHPSSLNRGCEAIAVSIAELIEKEGINATKTLYMKYCIDDEREDIGLISNHYTLKQVWFPSLKRYTPAWFMFNLYNRLISKNKAIEVVSRKYLSSNFDDMKNTDLFLSIGGDNYCYGVPTNFYAVNDAISKIGKKSILFGCSIEPSAIDSVMVSDLKKYKKIVARESITYNILKGYGLDNLELYPDPAFTLSAQMPDDNTITEGRAITEGTIGINASPMILRYAANNETLFNAYVNLIEYILKETNLTVTLIPHVSAKTTNDREVHSDLKEHFKDNDRVICIDDHNCKEQKYLISKCRMFIAARTHASIAAYSTCVPTLVTGYSVKALGIAKDLFGTHENYVIPVQSIEDEDTLVKGFKWLYENEVSIRSHLESKMPEYIKEAEKSVLVIKKVLENE